MTHALTAMRKAKFVVALSGTVTSHTKSDIDTFFAEPPISLKEVQSSNGKRTTYVEEFHETPDEGKIRQTDTLSLSNLMAVSENMILGE